MCCIIQKPVNIYLLIFPSLLCYMQHFHVFYFHFFVAFQILFPSGWDTICHHRPVILCVLQKKCERECWKEEDKLNGKILYDDDVLIMCVKSRLWICWCWDPKKRKHELNGDITADTGRRGEKERFSFEQ